MVGLFYYCFTNITLKALRLTDNEKDIRKVQPQGQLVAFQFVTAAHPLASLRCPWTWPWLPRTSTEMRLVEDAPWLSLGPHVAELKGTTGGTVEVTNWYNHGLYQTPISWDITPISIMVMYPLRPVLVGYKIPVSHIGMTARLCLWISSIEHGIVCWWFDGGNLEINMNRTAL